MVSQNPQKIGEANGMPSLPTGHTQLTLKENVGFSGRSYRCPAIHICP